MRHIRPRSGLRCSHDLSFQIASLPLGGGVPPRCIRETAWIVKELWTDHVRLMARLALAATISGQLARPKGAPHRGQVFTALRSGKRLGSSRNFGRITCD